MSLAAPNHSTTRPCSSRMGTARDSVQPIEPSGLRTRCSRWKTSLAARARSGGPHAGVLLGGQVARHPIADGPVVADHEPPAVQRLHLGPIRAHPVDDIGAGLHEGAEAGFAVAEGVCGASELRDVDACRLRLVHVAGCVEGQRAVGPEGPAWAVRRVEPVLDADFGLGGRERGEHRADPGLFPGRDEVPEVARQDGGMRRADRTGVGLVGEEDGAVDAEPAHQLALALDDGAVRLVVVAGRGLARAVLWSWRGGVSHGGTTSSVSNSAGETTQRCRGRRARHTLGRAASA